MNLKYILLIGLCIILIGLFIFIFYGIPKATKIYLNQQSPIFLEEPLIEQHNKFDWNYHFRLKDIDDDFKDFQREQSKKIKKAQESIIPLPAMEK